MTRRQWLLTTNVDHRAGQVALFQGFDQITIDHRHTATGVDEQRLGIEASK
ncbi:hypothetical protein D3C80_1921840 [compost metagenome]